MAFIIRKVFLLILLSVFFAQYSAGQKGKSELIIDSVSVINDDGHVIISWTLESDITDGNFAIHRRENGIYNTIATTSDLNTDHYIDTNVGADLQAQSYFISARKVDNGDYESFASSDAHQTIFLKNLNYDICRGTINIEWSNYSVTTTVGAPQPLPPPVDSTKILMSFNGNDYEIAEYASINQDFIEIPVENSGEYCIKIRSLNTEKTVTSTSNFKCKTVRALDKPEFAHLRNASVINNEFIRLRLYADSTIVNPSYVLYRSAYNIGEFTILDTIQTESGTFHYDDNTYEFERAKEYYFEIIDSCGRSVKTSNTVSSIFLTATSVSDTENELIWNHPEGLGGGISHYIIKRKDLQDDDFEILEPNIPSGQNLYTDHFTDAGEEMLFKEFVYKVKAVEGNNNPYGFTDTVNSNHAMVERDLELFIPNAFKPESTIEKNRTFKPIIRNVVLEKYELIIYNTWGEQIFITDDHETAWNGSHNKREAPTGTYLYSIYLKTSQGKEHKKNGTIKLIR